MTIFYVKWDATGLGDGSSWANAYTTIQAAWTGSNDDDTLEISGGVAGHTYQENINSAKQRTLVKGSSEVGHDGRVIIDGSGAVDDTLFAAHEFYLEKLNLTGATTGEYNLFGFGDHTLTDVKIYGDEGGFGLESVSAASTGDMVYTDCEFSGLAHKSVTIGEASSSATYTINNCIVKNNTYAFTGAITVTGGSLVTINNSVIIGNTQKAMSCASGSADVIINNSVIVENISHLDEEVISNEGTFSGTITINNPIILPSKSAIFGSKTYDYDTLSGGFEIKQPGFKSSLREGIVSLIIDDQENFDLWKSIADYAEVKNLKTVFGLNDTDNVSGADYIEMMNYISRGHDVACHTRNHPALTSLDGILWSSSATTPTIEITKTVTDNDSSNWTGQLLCKENGSIVETINLTGSTRLDTVATAIAAISGDWAASVAGTAASHIICLAIGAFAPGTLLLDQEDYFYIEVAESKADIESGTSIECPSFIPPGNETNADLRSYLKDDSTLYPGHFTRAGTIPFKIARGDQSGAEDLDSFDMFYIHENHINSTIDTINLERNTNTWGFWLAWNGKISMPYSHGAGEFSFANWQDYIDRLNDITGLKILTMAATYEYVSGSGLWINSSGTTWDRTWVDIWEDEIKSTSVGVDSGIHIPALYGADDPFGNKVYNKTNISRDQGAGAPELLSIGQIDNIISDIII